MAVQSEQVAAAPLVGGAQTALHSHAGGGGGPEIKSGVLVNQAYGSYGVTFGTAFAAAPRVVVSKSDNGRSDYVMVSSVTANGFTLVFTKDGGGANVNADLYWIATEAGG